MMPKIYYGIGLLLIAIVMVDGFITKWKSRNSQWRAYFSEVLMVIIVIFLVALVLVVIWALITRIAMWGLGA